MRDLTLAGNWHKCLDVGLKGLQNAAKSQNAMLLNCYLQDGMLLPDLLSAQKIQNVQRFRMLRRCLGSLVPTALGEGTQKWRSAADA